MKILITALLAAGAWGTAIVSNAAEKATPATIDFALQKAGKVTVNIYDAEGRIARELLGGQPLEAGQQSLPWDGLDYMDRPLPPGKYTWKAIVHDGVKAEWLGAVGNSGTPPYLTADNTGSWGGDHGGANAVAADDTGCYFLWGDAEAGMSALKIDRNDKTVWRHRTFVFDCKNAIGAGGKYVFIGVVRDGGDCVLGRFDAATGGGAVFPSGQAFVSLPQKAKLERGWTRAGGQRPGTPEPVIVPPAKPRTDPWVADALYLRKYADNPGGIQVKDGKVYVSMCHEDKILVVDAEKGDLLSSIDVPLPRGIAFAPDGSLLAVSVLQDETGRVVRIDTATGKATTLVKDGLEIPTGLACDKQGNFYVSDRGPCQQIRKFAPDGKPLLTIGKKGGRPYGKYDGRDLRDPGGICVAPDGFLYVPESGAPKRIGRFTLDGKLVKEWFGPIGYASPAYADPENLGDVYYWWGGCLIRAKLDYKTRAWTVDAVWGVMLPEGVSRGVEDMRVMHTNGHLYLYGEGHAQPIFIIDGYNIRQVSSVGKHAGYIAPLPKEWFNENFSWYDANGTGKVEEGELQVVKSQYGSWLNGLVGSYLTDKFVWYIPDNNRIFRLRPIEVDKSGAPHYSWDPKYVDFPVTQFNSETGGESTGCELDAQGNIYTIWNVGGPTPVRSWWGTRYCMNRVAKFTPDGKPVWEAGRHCSGDVVKPGEMYHIWKTAGLIDDWIFITDTNGLYHIYTTDGFFLDTLMNDPSKPDSPPGPYTLMSENFCGGVAKDPKTGKIYLFASDTAAHIYEVKGLGKVTRFEGTAELKTWPDFPGEAVPAGKPYPITRIPAKALFYREGIALDWNRIPGILLHSDGKPVAQVKVAVDNDRVHIVAQVLDASPLKNNADPAAMAFISGDEVSIYLGCDAAADPTRRTPVAGDVRIVLAAPGGKTQLICYKPVDPESKTPFIVQSPVNKTVFASALSNPMEACCISKVWSDGRGYTVEADVPFKVIPQIANSLGKTIKFDVEVGLSDPAGNKLAARIPWQGGSDSMAASSEDGPTAARLEPAAWGKAELPPAPGK